MAALERPVVKPRPVYLNLLAIRQPLPAIVSFLHRVSGLLLFLLGIPLLLWGTHLSLASPDGFAQFKAVLGQPFSKLCNDICCCRILEFVPNQVLLAGQFHCD